MSNSKKQIELLQKENEELKAANKYLQDEMNSIWTEVRKKQEQHKDIAQRIVRMDSKPIANIILNMHFGRTPSDSVSFCDIFNLRETEYHKKYERCTDCIEAFLQDYYTSKHPKGYYEKQCAGCQEQKDKTRINVPCFDCSVQYPSDTTYPPRPNRYKPKE